MIHLNKAANWSKIQNHLYARDVIFNFKTFRKIKPMIKIIFKIVGINVNTLKNIVAGLKFISLAMIIVLGAVVIGGLLDFAFILWPFLTQYL